MKNTYVAICELKKPACCEYQNEIVLRNVHGGVYPNMNTCDCKIAGTSLRCPYFTQHKIEEK